MMTNQPTPTTSIDSTSRIVHKFRDVKKGMTLLLAGIVALWLLESIDAVLLQDWLNNLGIRPRTRSGLWGILWAPALHGDFVHLSNNTFGLLLFGTLIACFGRRELVFVTLAGWLFGGLGVWLLGRTAIHIGASGVVFAMFGYLLLRGWHERKVTSIMVSCGLLSVYGAALWGMFPWTTPRGVSWEGHLFGFFAGVGTSALLHRASRARAERSMPETSPSTVGTPS